KRNAFWLIDNRIMPQPAGKGGFGGPSPAAQRRHKDRTDIGVGARELTDPEARLRDMDRHQIRAQIIHPSLFLNGRPQDPELEYALCRAYNSFLASACSKSVDRLKWVAILPLSSMDAALQELKRAKDLGAVGLLMRGIEGERTLDDAYFFPLYDL